MSGTLTTVFSAVNIAIIAFFAVLLVYCMVLFIRLAQKASRALDIYIRKNERGD